MPISNIGAAVLGTAGAAVLGTLTSKLVNSLADKAADETVGKAIQIAKHTMERNQSQSLVSFTQSARVEPILLMDEKALYVPFIQDVVHTMSSLFTAYYLQAIALDTTLSGVKVLKRLDRFNPDRNLNAATQALLSSAVSAESYKYGLPFPGQSVGLEAYGIMPSFEAVNEQDQSFKVKLERQRENARIKQIIAEEFGNKTPTEEEIKKNQRIAKAVEEEDKKDPVSTLVTRDVGKMVTDISNLAVGQIIEVTITEGNQSAKIPVTIRLRVTGMPSNVLVQTLSVGGVDTTVGTRWRQWRAGELRFWADLVLAQDRIKAHRDAAAKDKSGYYKAVTERNDKNLVAEIMSQGGPSVGTASSIIVLTDQTRKDLERNITGRISDFKTRERIFGNTFAMLMAVVDPEWGTLTIYHRGIEMPTNLTESNIKKAGSGNGPDIAEILKAYQLGSAPSRL